MNIEQALRRIGWRFKNHWKPNEADLKAYNAIVDFVELQQSVNLSANENMAKLWIQYFMLLNSTELYNAERSIQVIDEILSKSVYEWALRLKDQNTAQKINVLLGKDPEYVQALKLGNVSKMKEASSVIISKEKESALEVIKNDIDEDLIIKFIEKQITRIINKFEK